MNYTRIQIELLRKSLATLASARGDIGEVTAEPTHTAEVELPKQTPASATADSASERTVVQQNAAVFFGGLDWSGAPFTARTEPPKTRQADPSPVREGKAAEYFCNLPWAGSETTGKAAGTPASVRSTDAARSALPNKKIFPDNARAFFTDLPWAVSAQQQNQGATRAADADLSPADFAQMATRTALASATRKAAS